MKRLLIVLTALCLVQSAFSTDVIQWRGNDRTGTYPEKNLLDSWPEDGPKMLWSTEELGIGYSGPVIVGDTVYITGTSDDKKQELIYAIDSKSGKVLWSKVYGTAWTKTFPEARTSPRVLGDYIYLISAAGELVCLNYKTQEIKWSVDAAKQYDGKCLTWGYAENPLIFEGKIFFNVGGKKTAMIALNIEDGSLVWKTESLDASATYVSPIAVEYKGKKQIISGAVPYVFGVDANTGEIIWKNRMERFGTLGRPAKDDWDTNASTPIYRDGMFFASNGYNCGGVLFKLPEDGEDSCEFAWVNPDFDMHHGGFVLIGDRLYGSTWINNEKGSWISCDWKTGKTIYEHEWDGYSKGSIISADNKLFIHEERKGNVAIINPNSDKFEVVSTFKIPLGSGKSWNHLVICNGVMYARHGKALMAYDISKK